jgi:hypothetical protein
VSIVVFLGPTLDRASAMAELDALYLPPVAQGDVYRAARKRPRAIGIVDGYFDRMPSVWHKEILWALSRGIYVFGAASMGALRAAELAEFGMIGVGHIFKSFHDGVLEDDDEVAIAHSSAEDGYRAQSDAMVDIRASVSAALAAGVVGEESAIQLISLAKSLPYPERSLRRLVRDARGVNLPCAEALADWFPEHAVPRKRNDALMMLRAMRQMLGVWRDPFVARFRFEHTDAWESAKNYVSPDPADDDQPALDAGLVDELRLNGSWEQARMGALARSLILSGPASRLLPQLDPTRAERDFRLARGLHSVEDFAAWCHDQAATPEQLRQFFVEEAAIQIIALAWRAETMRELPNYLRGKGELGALQERVKKKAALTRSPTGQRAYLQDLGLDEKELFAWYFAQRGYEGNAEHYAERSGFEDLADFRRAVLSEYLLQR